MAVFLFLFHFSFFCFFASSFPILPSSLSSSYPSWQLPYVLFSSSIFCPFPFFWFFILIVSLVKIPFSIVSLRESSSDNSDHNNSNSHWKHFGVEIVFTVFFMVCRKSSFRKIRWKGAIWRKKVRYCINYSDFNGWSLLLLQQLRLLVK